MRTAMALAAMAIAASTASAQSLEERRDKKLKEPFLAKAAWLTDFDEAKAASMKAGKPIFAYFTRSYAP